MSPLLRVRGLSVEFPTRQGPVHAVQGLSFEIARGDTLALVGESGSGKSTVALALLRLVASPGRIVSGEILFDGRDLVPLSEDEIRKVRGRDIAMIFQDPMMALNPVHTIGDQIAEAVRLHLGGTKAEALERALELLRLVRVPAPERRVRELSSPDVGRHAPARHDRHGARLRSRALDSGRANDGSRRDHPGAGARDHAPAEGALGMAILFITHDLGVVAEIA